MRTHQIQDDGGEKPHFMSQLEITVKIYLHAIQEENEQCALIHARIALLRFPRPHSMNDNEFSAAASATTFSGDGERLFAQLACNECRRRKGRCDRISPECSTCVRYNRHCLYAQDVKSPLTRK
jgi:hypothetical protein